MCVTDNAIDLYIANIGANISPIYRQYIGAAEITCISVSSNICCQGVLSWHASGDRQIILSASAERAFANFRVKNDVFTGTHFCAVLSMVGEGVFVNFRKFVN